MMETLTAQAVPPARDATDTQDFGDGLPCLVGAVTIVTPDGLVGGVGSLAAADPAIESASMPEGPATVLATGRPVIVSGCSGGAFLLLPVAAATPSWINLMATHARGLVGMVITSDHAMRLGLPLQPRRGRAGGALYTQSIEARQGVSTGISADDRALTIAAAAGGRAEDIVTPGHVFPQVPSGAADGPADVALALLRAAGLPEIGVICTILGANGDIASAEDLARLSQTLAAPVAFAGDL